MRGDDEDGAATLSQRDEKSVNSRSESVTVYPTSSETTAREPANIEDSSDEDDTKRTPAEELCGSVRAETTSSNSFSKGVSNQSLPAADAENLSNASLSAASGEAESSLNAASRVRMSPPQEQPPSTTPVVRSAALLERIQNERKRSQARVQVIKRLRNLKARSVNTKTTHNSIKSYSQAVSVGFGESIVDNIISVESHDISESNSSISTETRVTPPATVLVDTSASRYLEAARIERDRANEFLVELAKAKAEILRLKYEEEAFKNYHSKRLRQAEQTREEHSTSTARQESETATSTPWTSRFWNKRQDRRDNGSQQTDRNQSVAETESKSQDAEDSRSSYRKVGATEGRQEHQQRNRHHSAKSRTIGNRTIEENQELLQQLMQVMSSLHVRTDLSVLLDLKPCVHGWSLNSATVRRPEEGGGAAADGKSGAGCPSTIK